MSGVVWENKFGYREEVTEEDGTLFKVSHQDLDGFNRHLRTFKDENPGGWIGVNKDKKFKRNLKVTARIPNTVMEIWYNLARINGVDWTSTEERSDFMKQMLARDEWKHYTISS